MKPKSTLRPLLIAAAGALLATSAHAADGTWNTDSAGDWTDITKWLGDVDYASGADFTATFGDFITADRIINLDAPITIGNITASDTTHNYTISGANILTLDRTDFIAPTINVVTAGRTLTIASEIAGNDGLQKTGAGTLALTGNNSYSGTSTLAAGTLSIGHDSALGGSTLTFNGGTIQSTDATLRTLSNLIAVNSNISVGTTGNLTFSNTGSVALGGSRSFTINGGTTTFAQSFSGTSQSITKAGAGTLVLSGNNSGVTGGTILSGGTLVLAGASALPSGTITFGTTNTTLRLQQDGATPSVSNAWTVTGRSLNRTLVVDRVTPGAANDWTITQQWNTLDTGTVFNFQKGSNITSGTPTLTLSGGIHSSDSADGTIRLVPDGVNLRVSAFSNSRSRTMELSGTSTGNEVIGGIVDSNTGLGRVTGVTKTGIGTWTLSANNSYTRATTISAGTLQLGKGGTTGALTGTASITNNGNLTINRSNAFTQGTDLANKVISGSGSFTQAGAGTTTLSLANTYIGATSVTAGILSVSTAGTINNTSGVSIGAGDFNYNNSTTALTQGITFSGSTGTLSGTGTITPAVVITSGNRQTAGTSVTAINTTATLGKQSFGTSIDFQAGSIFEWNLTANTETSEGTRGTNYDAVDTASLLNTGADAIFRVVLNGTENFDEAFWNADRTWNDIFKNGGTSLDIAAIFGNSVQYYNSTGLIANGNTTGRSFTITGTSLNWTAIPEPSTALGGLLLTAGLLRRRRQIVER